MGAPGLSRARYEAAGKVAERLMAEEEVRGREEVLVLWVSSTVDEEDEGETSVDDDDDDVVSFVSEEEEEEEEDNCVGNCGEDETDWKRICLLLFPSCFLRSFHSIPASMESTRTKQVPGNK